MPVNDSCIAKIFVGQRIWVLYWMCGTERMWGFCGKCLGKISHFTHFFPMSYQDIAHPHNFSPFYPTISPQMFNKSAFSLHVPHLKINILSTNQHFVNVFLNKNVRNFKVGKRLSTFSQHLPHTAPFLSLSILHLRPLFYPPPPPPHSNPHNCHNQGKKSGSLHHLRWPAGLT